MIKGLGPPCFDDTILFLEAISGIRINLFKIEIIPINIDTAPELARLFQCTVGKFPLLKYLGFHC